MAKSSICDWFAAVRDKPDLSAISAGCGTRSGATLMMVAVELTLRWQQIRAAKDQETAERRDEAGEWPRAARATPPHAWAAAHLSRAAAGGSAGRKKEGRAAEQTGLDPAGDPIIGVALSFPTSDTVIGVEYRVNKVWDAELREDDEYDD